MFHDTEKHFSDAPKVCRCPIYKTVEDTYHDIQTPLAIVSTIGKLLERGDFSAEEFGSLGTKLLTSSRSIESIVNGLFSHSNFPLLLREGDIIAYAADIAESMKMISDKRGISIVYLPDRRKRIIRFDGTCIERILQNVIINAIKFSPDCGVVEVLVHNTPDDITFVVSDSGSGVPDGELDTIFSRSSRFGEKSGMGLGLSIAKSSVQRFNGSIRAVNRPNRKGLSVIITLPVPGGESMY